MKIGLFFGSFNPVHVGHLIIANYFATNTDLKEVWFVVSPQNPFKEKATLLRDYDRLNLVNLAIEDNYALRANNIEFSLPQPSYTINTLMHIKEKYPANSFCLIMGSDNFISLPKWKNADIILRDYEIYVYQRRGSVVKHVPAGGRVNQFDFPLLDISSSQIRKLIENNLSVKYMIPDKVLNYIVDMGLYKK